MPQDGIIEELLSPLTSPIVVVLKADGNLYFCNDFWRLNQFGIGLFFFLDLYIIQQFNLIINSIFNTA